MNITEDTAQITKAIQNMYRYLDVPADIANDATEIAAPIVAGESDFERAMTTILISAFDRIAEEHGHTNRYRNKEYADLATAHCLTPPAAPHRSRGYENVTYVKGTDSDLEAFALAMYPKKPTGGVLMVMLCGCEKPRRLRIAPTVAAAGAITCGLCKREFLPTA